jgi:hypothetical protein
VVAAILVGGVVTPASAISGRAPVGIEGAAGAVIGNDRAIADDAAVMEFAADAARYESFANGVEVTLPVDPSGPATFGHTGAPIEVTLPAADAAGSLTLTDLGLLAYDNRNGSYTVPIAGEDGSLQINTVIGSVAAPQKYKYRFDLPADVDAHSVGGSLLFLDAEGGLLLMIAKPWATDASGKPVPTHYEVDGSVVTQIVEHDASYAYPIVADPWLGVTLYHLWKRDSYSSDFRYSAWVTPQAVAVLGLGGGPAGYAFWLAVLSGAGWYVCNPTGPANKNNATLKQQYDCHVSAGIYGLPFTQDYNLERFRPNRTNGNWAANVIFHKCNWTTASGS